MRILNRSRNEIGVVMLSSVFFGWLAFFAFDIKSNAVNTQAQSTSTTSNGLRVVTIDTPEARVTVKLPEDIRSGDDISGTVVQEPKGSTDAEREKNRSAVRSKMIRLILTRLRKPWEPPVVGQRPAEEQTLQIPLDGGSTKTVQTIRGRGNTTTIEFKVAPADFALAPGAVIPAEAELGSAEIPVAEVDKDPTTGKKQPTKFDIPPLGQTGRPVVVKGPFDGKASNTEVIQTEPPQKPFIKISMSYRDVYLPVIAESPRAAFIEYPSDVIGRARLTVTDGRTRTSGPFRNVDVNVSAPKIQLLRGEKTIVTVRLRGLEGLATPVPMILASSGVITMEGGAYQPLMIKPSDVRADGTYLMTREVTGIQTGVWGATATVMTSPFDIVLFDPLPRRAVVVNSFTGDYVFCEAGPKLTGTGTIRRNGCVIELKDDKPDRQVLGTFDGCIPQGALGALIPGGAIVDLEVTVTDTRPVRTRLHINPRGKPAPLIQGVSAFATCP